jgi:hypothetical protein
VAAGDERFFENAQAIFREPSESLFVDAKVYSQLALIGVTSSKSLDWIGYHNPSCDFSWQWFQCGREAGEAVHLC